jgi:hypothetical protein
MPDALETAQAAERDAWLALWNRYGTTSRQSAERTELTRTHEEAQRRLAHLTHDN